MSDTCKGCGTPDSTRHGSSLCPACLRKCGPPSIRLTSLETHYAVQQHDVEWLLNEIERLEFLLEKQHEALSAMKDRELQIHTSA